ncbi:ArsC family reductase [Undibacterium sp. Jales W-56]|uniref:ArsC family reductase n=1 Tax=Undibacterium sp. Jales W-56 TaxID=2897325 RepID=UPI0021D1FEED|nr:ArsC family reductase [Undibacterium sp. Jales W-56]MCU6433627.1 ArsC family reductase [Undibacterium sp. Jales W-56]
MHSLVLYGIPNCDTVKKARTWLQEQGIAFTFHDFKKNGLDRQTIQTWLRHTDLDILINRKGTTWRALTDQQKNSVSDVDAAIELMIASPSVIKRPVLQMQIESAAPHIEVGFSAQQYQPLFK